MIKANELRIGNKLNFLGDVVTFKNITEIREDGIFWIKTFEPKIESKNFHFKPIEITEDWLLIFGFKKRKNRHLFHWENKIVISEYKDEFENFFYPKTGYDIRFSNEIKYVHQLQNLYFALTGAELTVAYRFVALSCCRKIRPNF